MIFTPSDVQDRLRERPFTPIRIVTTTGEKYDVKHPDLVLVAQHFLEIGFGTEAYPTVAQKITRVALVHITEIQDIPTTVSPTNNGPVA